MLDTRSENQPDKNKRVNAWKIDVKDHYLQSALFKFPVLANTINSQMLTQAAEDAYLRDSDPTANFKLDSYYQEISIDDVKNL